MKKTSSGIIVTLLLSGMLMMTFNIQPAVSSEPPETEWERTYGGTGHDLARSIVQTNDGGYAIAGRTESFGAGSGDAWLVKTDSFGIYEGDQTYGGADNDYAHSLIRTADGGYAMAGSTESFGAGGRDFWLVKTDQSGNLQWSKTYGGTNDEEVQWGLVQTDDEGYAMAGYTLSYGAGGYDFWLVKTDSNGNMQWSQTYGGTNDDWAISVIRTSDGGFAMTGWTSSYGVGEKDVWLIKTNSTGGAEWNQTYGESRLDEGYSVIQTHDGGYAIAGNTRSFGATRRDWLLLRTDSSGGLLWHRIYGEAYDDYAHFIQQTDNEGFLIVGDTQVSSVGASFDGWLVKTDSTGQIQWDKTFGEADVRDGLDWVIETADGGYALAGEKGGPVIGGTGDFDFWLIKLAPEEIPATVNIDPDTLNLKSNGQWIAAYIELPQEYSVGEIHVSLILLNGSICVDLEAPKAIGDHDMDGIPDLMVKFDRGAVIEWLGASDYGEDTGKSVDVALVIIGEAAGAPFEGVDTIRVLLKS